MADKEFKSLLKIRLIGKTDADILQTIKDAGLGGNMYYPGYQPHEVAVQEQRNASFLLLCLRQEPEYASAVPGKIFEYLASRRPILGIGQTDSIMAKMIRDTSWEEFRNGELKDNISDISRYDRRVITRQLAGYLDEMTRDKQS